MIISRPAFSLWAYVSLCRETPLHQLYSSAFSKQKFQGAPTKKPALPFGDLPTGYQHLHTQLQYECISPFYRRLGSSRRTCLRTGKWSGRAPSCIPSESRLFLGWSGLFLTWLPMKSHYPLLGKSSLSKGIVLQYFP